MWHWSDHLLSSIELVLKIFLSNYTVKILHQHWSFFRLTSEGWKNSVAQRNEVNGITQRSGL